VPTEGALLEAVNKLFDEKLAGYVKTKTRKWAVARFNSLINSKSSEAMHLHRYFFEPLCSQCKQPLCCQGNQTRGEFVTCQSVHSLMLSPSFLTICFGL
jgi:hypothetical protein